MEIIDILAIISLVVFYALFIGRTVILYKKGIKVWVIGTSGKKTIGNLLENILPLVLVLWFVFIVLVAIHIKLPNVISRYLLKTDWIKYPGIALCYFGLILFLSALLSFGKAWRIGIDEDNANELITTGVFKYSRNPIFLFMDLYFIGITLIYPNIVFSVVTLCTTIGVHLQILREETFLLKKFGEKYENYKKHTRRYL
jgi:protein-S-isoprenylcysteine O-methyltransferase Ste14